MKQGKQLIYCLMALTVLLGSSQAALQNRCAPLFLNSDNVAFDFNQVNPTDPNNPVAVNNGATSTLFLLCQGIPDSAANCVNNLPDNLAYVTVGGQCYPITTTATKLTTDLQKDADGAPSGVIQIYDNSNVQAPDKNKLYTKNLKIILNCDKSTSNGQAQWTVDNSDPAYLTFTTKTAAACGTSLHDIFSFFIKYKWYFGGLLILLGVLFTFFGKRFFIITLTTVGFLIGFLSIVGTAYLFSAMQNADSKKVMVVLFLGLCMGLAVAWLFYKFKSVTTMAALGLLFFFIGNAVIRTYLSKYVTENWQQILIVVAIVVIGVAVGFFASNYCIMFATAFGGAFLFIFSIGMMSGTLDSPSVVAQKIQRGEYNQTWTIVWGAIWAALGLSGLIVQIIRHNKHPEEGDISDKKKSYDIDDSYNKA